MIHLEAITDSIIYWMRIYEGVPQEAPAFDHRLDFDGTALVIWHPRSGCATITGLHVCGSFSKGTAIDIMERLHADLGVVVIEWQRASGKKQRKRRVGKRKWIDF